MPRGRDDSANMAAVENWRIFLKFWLLTINSLILLSVASAQARDNGVVNVSGTTVPAQLYYQTVGSRQGALAQYAYSATNIRLREASIGYTFPGTAFNNKINSIRVAFTGRNLFFFYLKAPFDPETDLATDNTLQGLDLFGQPSTRQLGFNVSARF